MAVSVRTNSRLNFYDLIIVDSTEFFEHAIAPDFEEQDDDILVTVEDGMRLDLLAYQYYGDAELMWVILQANDIFCYPYGVYVGKQIRLPHRDRVVGKTLEAKTSVVI